jgi:hypothetical protein
MFIKGEPIGAAAASGKGATLPFHRDANRSDESIDPRLHAFVREVLQGLPGGEQEHRLRRSVSFTILPPMARGEAAQRKAPPSVIDLFTFERKRRATMRLLGKTAIVLGMAGAVALGSMTASQARHFRAGPAVAAGVAGLALGAAAANSYGYGYDSYGYDSYAYEPGYGSSYYGSASPYSNYDGYYGYNSNAVSPMRERQLEGNDY